MLSSKPQVCCFGSAKSKQFRLSEVDIVAAMLIFVAVKFILSLQNSDSCLFSSKDKVAPKLILLLICRFCFFKVDFVAEKQSPIC